MRKRERERERAKQGRGRERREQRIPSRLCADSREPDAGRTQKLQDHDPNWSWTSNRVTQVSLKIFFDISGIIPILLFKLLFCLTVNLGYLFVFFFFFNVYLSLRERDTETEHKWGRGRERDTHRILSRLQALSCQHRAPSGTQTMNCEITTWSKVRQLTNWAI